jgi:protein-S-isoprenylcysteine O-methyltransferase Ste14
MSSVSADIKEPVGWQSRLAAAGRRLFGKRLFVGLIIAFAGLEVLTPKPFFSPGHRAAQACALLFVAAGLALRAWGSGCAGFHTRSARIEAPRLITGGPFAYVRNPIYTGTMCLGFGMAALIGDPLAYVLAALAFAILYFSIVPAEESFLQQQFGEAYARYRRAVPRIIPRLTPWRESDPVVFQWRAAIGEGFIALITAGIYVALHVEEYLDRVVR